MDPTLNFSLFFMFLILSTSFSTSTSYSSLTGGSSLYVENQDDSLVSPNGKFSAGFLPHGDNAYYFSIWSNQPHCSERNCAMVWSANRNFPVNGKRSKLSLKKTGNLTLFDAGQTVVWATDTDCKGKLVSLELFDNGNLVLKDSEGVTLWQSYDSPTDTLLPQQPLTKDTQLVSSRSRSNFSSGFYKLFFDFDNVLRLAFVGPQQSSIYWPDPTALDYQNGRGKYNDTRIAVFDTKGYFNSSDRAAFGAADYGEGPQRRLTLDFDGNLRLYSYEETSRSWSVTYQAMYDSCKIHGLCGPNSLCVYDPRSGGKCTCPPNFKMKNQRDWSYGCESEFELSCNKRELSFFEIQFAQFYGYEKLTFKNYTLEKCKDTCLEMCWCKGFQHQLIAQTKVSNCYLKTELRNGYRSPQFNGTMFLKYPKAAVMESLLQEFQLNCSSDHAAVLQLKRTYLKNGGNSSLKTLLLCASVIGGLEIISFIVVNSLLGRAHPKSDKEELGYLAIVSGFRRFTYKELKKATGNFSQELGKGGGGTVYKGLLLDQRIAAVKQLNEANQGEEEFLAEISTLGKLNHMNLIDIWGYCAEGKHRLIVYEYMENGCLADNMSSGSLDWDKRFAIAVGTAKGLAYLHEECLEWVLHCDVKPQNILLDANYQPKVSDFGLSKILNRGGAHNPDFSRVRGTRGYMAPEWVFNLPITSKVDVYSYGMVVLEMVTGKKPCEHQSLVTWVREMKNQASEMESWTKNLVDPAMELGGESDSSKMENLVLVALQCVKEGAEARPTMTKVVEMLVHHEIIN